VLSGNRNFEGRVTPDVRANYLASPPLVVAYAIAGRVDLDPTEPLGTGKRRQAGVPADIWPTQQEITRHASRARSSPSSSTKNYATCSRRRGLALAGRAQGRRYAWDKADSTYVRRRPIFAGLTPS
jgi:aconitate hydratase